MHEIEDDIDEMEDKHRVEDHSVQERRIVSKYSPERVIVFGRVICGRF